MANRAFDVASLNAVLGFIMTSILIGLARSTSVDAVDPHGLPA